jgi:hypothetical protein
MSLPTTFLRLVITLGLAGCTRTQDATPEAGRPPEGQSPASPATITSATRGAQGTPRITHVRAHGSGCPSETSYQATVAPDGQSASVELRAYEVSVGPGKAMAIQDCTFSVRAESGPHHAYAIGALESVVRASVEGTGVRGEETLRTSIQGNPTPSESRSKEFVPDPSGGDAGTSHAASYAFPADGAVWSPCGGGRDLAVQSRIVLRNNPDKSGRGQVSPSTLKLTLTTRACSG